MWWPKRKQSQFETKGSDAELRAQLAEACDKIRHQIEVQNSVRYSQGGGYDGDYLAVHVLQTQLDQLEEALATLAGSGSA